MSRLALLLCTLSLTACAADEDDLGSLSQAAGGSCEPFEAVAWSSHSPSKPIMPDGTVMPTITFGAGQQPGTWQVVGFDGVTGQAVFSYWGTSSELDAFLAAYATDISTVRDFSDAPISAGKVGRPPPPPPPGDPLWGLCDAS